MATIGTLLVLVGYVVFTHLWRQAKQQPHVAQKLAELHATLAKPR
jgi:hypothetical protein